MCGRRCLVITFSAVLTKRHKNSRDIVTLAGVTANAGGD